MKKLMRTAAAVTLALCLLFTAALILFEADFLLPLAITSGTFAYHFGMRLIVGHIYNKAMGNRADCTKGWYRLRPWEKRLYKRLKVKSWKNRMPTYDPSLFSPEERTWGEICEAMCQAELVHETIALLSFLPLIASAFLGDFWVFLITSVLAALLDLAFAVMQRYNRPRVMRLAAREEKVASGGPEPFL